MQYITVILLLNLLNAGLIKPENLDTLSKVHVLFEWKQEPDYIDYNIQISSFNNFSEILLDTNINSLLFIDKNNLSWNSQYYWRVKPISGNWIDTSSFLISNKKYNDTDEILIELDNMSRNKLIFYRSAHKIRRKDTTV